LAEEEIEGERLTDDEKFAFLLLILPAAVESATHYLFNVMVC
jgi:hypothetical protein